MGHTAEFKQKVLDLYQEGYSAGEVGRLLGVTRNVALGVIQRNKGLIEIRPKKQGRAVKPRTKQTVPACGLLAYEASPADSVPFGSPTCRYLYGGKGAWRQCGQPRAEGSSYCKAHREKIKRKPVA